MARITPDELYEMILSGRKPAIVDARSNSALDVLPFIIEGALLMTLEQIDERHLEIPREKDVIVYCS
jgi:rhodanese-related sulfurtransferase